MLRTLGITGLGPKRENRIIFYSIIFLLLATLLYVLSFYGEDGKEQEPSKEEGPSKAGVNEKGEQDSEAFIMAGTPRSINFNTVVELSKSF